MIFCRKFLLIFTLLFLFAGENIFAQIVFKELPEYNLKKSDSLFFDITSTRKIISLNGLWQVYRAEDEDKQKVNVTVPSVFEGTGELVFEKSFDLTSNQINNHNLSLHFFGLNYTADISVNGVIIYRHSGGEFPFKIELPRDILNPDKSNKISIKLFYKLDSENTIPVKQRFLFPENFGGIIRDVYLKLLPAITIYEKDISLNYSSNNNSGEINLNTRIRNREIKNVRDSVEAGNSFNITAYVISPNGTSQYFELATLTVNKNQEKFYNGKINFNNPLVWSPANPNWYILRLELFRNGKLLDASIQKICFYNIEPKKEGLIFNGKPLQLKGATYVPAYGQFGSLATYTEMENDIKAIKNLGFNSVRFIKTVPHPYYLDLCTEYGIIALVEIPLNSIPESLTQNQNFIERSRNYLSKFVETYKRFGSVAGIGAGGGFLANSDAHRAFLQELGGVIKDNSSKFSYASFFNSNIQEINKIDIYGIELFNIPPQDVQKEIQNLQGSFGAGKIILSSATYTVTRGNTDGYVNEHSFEAQAKFFENVFDYAANNPLSGYFINSMFDYRGNYSSFTSGYNKENLYRIGIVSEERDFNRIGYKVLFSKLHNTEEVTIPIGSSKDDSPMAFIIFGIAFAILMGILINSGRKFREDATRALLRPYNFFADIRDQRILSGYHSIFLGIINAAILGLIIANLLFFFKESFLYEKLLLSFGSPWLMQIVNYFAWHPLASLLWISVAFAVIFFIFTLIIKVASFFIRNKVYLSSIYYTVVWAFLPVVLLIPVGIVLYRILLADIINIYIYIALIIFTVWIFYRLIKGIYVIFDVNPGSVYFYTILFLLLFLGGVLFFYEFNNSVIDYISLTLKQFN